MTLARAGAIAGLVSLGAILLLWGYALANGSLLGVCGGTVIAVCIVWCPQAIIVFGTVAYFGKPAPEGATPSVVNDQAVGTSIIDADTADSREPQEH